MRRRKLLTERTLAALVKDIDRGVPLARAMQNANVSMSRPSVDKLVKAYRVCQNKDSPHMLAKDVHKSLFPSWLDIDGQEQPDNSEYTGLFPFGAWV